MIISYELGANLQKDGICVFSVWAPFASGVAVEIVSQNNRRIEASRMMYGYWKAEDSRVHAGDRYFFILDGSERLPDPASRFQPEGVHGPGEVVDPDSFRWTDTDWQGLPQEQMILYELHTGTFSEKGDFDGIIGKLPYLKELGVNGIELMPVAQFPGQRNWGYDGVFLFAVQQSYGGPDALARLVNACHRNGLAVILDVVYNHLGPEGNYLERYGPYFSDRYKTPWGKAVNVDDQYADGMINFILQNIRYWFRDLHIDGLRLDAVHAICDFSAEHIMRKMSREAERLADESGRKHFLIAESNLNDVRYLHSAEKGGYGLDAQWNDDFHHAVHSYFTGEKNGYYADYGSLEDLAKSIRTGFVLDGVYSIVRKRTFGSRTDDVPAGRFVNFIQNHDHVGNRKNGERLGQLIGPGMMKMACSILFLSPGIPLLFMGEEFNAQTPFLYFVSHNDEQLNRLVREGRESEFADFHTAKAEPTPSPDLEETWRRSMLDWSESEGPAGRDMLDFYRKMIMLRKLHPALASNDRDQCMVRTGPDQNLVIHRRNEDHHLLACFNFNKVPATIVSGTGTSARLFLLLHSDFTPGLPQAIEGEAVFGLPKQSFAIYSSWPDPTAVV